MPLAPASRSRRDSWPPTQVRLDASLPSEDNSLDNIDDDPLTYFLTPAPILDAMGDIDMMDFDAGIEDLNHPREIVRSVSPSSLNGLSRPHPREASPELSDGSAPDYDDEEYIRFQPHTLGLPFNLRDFTIDGIKMKPKSPAGPTVTADALLSPSSFHVPTAQGRSQARGHVRGRVRTASARHRPQHLWREPSPDVWSIEEETEEEITSEMSGSVGVRSDFGDEMEKIHNHTLETPAAKPKKKVRFVLPAREE
jgi:hypothetical protein